MHLISATPNQLISLERICGAKIPDFCAVHVGHCLFRSNMQIPECWFGSGAVFSA
jgi:hypothetical protein